MRLLGGLLLALLSQTTALAARPVLLQSFGPAPGSSRPDARTARLQARLAMHLGSRVVQGRAALRALRLALDRPAVSLSAERLSKLVSAVKSGAEHAYAGEWQEALADLRSARLGLMGDVLSLARKRLLFRALQRARMLLVMCYLRQGKRRSAWAMMEESLRSQPDMSPSGVLYGPDIQRLYYRVKAQLDLQRARLRVRTNPPGALIFLNGRSVGFSPLDVSGIYPGTYDLLVVKGSQHSHIKRLQLKSTGAEVLLDLGLESSLVLGEQISIRVAPGSRGRAQALRYAARLGRLLASARVLLVGVHDFGKGKVLLGRLVDSARRTVIRAAFVPLGAEDPGADLLGKLGRYLLEGGVPGQGVRKAALELLPRHTWRSSAGRQRRISPPITGYGVAGWLLLSAGLAGVATGGTLWGIDGLTRIGASRRADRYDTDLIGKVSLGVGLGAVAVGSVLLIVDRVRRARQRVGSSLPRLVPTVTLARASLSAGVAGTF